MQMPLAIIWHSSGLTLNQLWLPSGLALASDRVWCGAVRTVWLSVGAIACESSDVHQN